MNLPQNRRFKEENDDKVAYVITGKHLYKPSNWIHTCGCNGGGRALYYLVEKEIAFFYAITFFEVEGFFLNSQLLHFIFIFI